jgi:hypothetical protein
LQLPGLTSDLARVTLDLKPFLFSLPLLEASRQHNPQVMPREVYTGMEYSWHGTYILSISPDSLPGMKIQVPPFFFCTSL